MLHFNSLQEAEQVFKALSTPMRLKIMEMIYENDNLSMNDLAVALGLTNGAISMHVNKLEEAGLVKIRTTSGKRGTMKLVRPRYERLMIDMAPQKEHRLCYTDDIRVGYYTNCNITPTCGLSTPRKSSVLLMMCGYFPFRNVSMQIFCGSVPVSWSTISPTIYSPVRA